MNKRTQKLVLSALLTAVVILFQFVGAFIHLGPFSVSLVLLPIVMGAALCGVGTGAWLGLVFGAVVLLCGDAAAFLAVNAPGTIVTVLAKGIACGTTAGIVYKIFEKKNKYAAVAAAAIACPVVNTGIFLLGCVVFFMDTIAGWAQGLGFENVGEYIIFVLAGGNFLFELALNLILCPVAVRLLNIGKKQQ